MKKILKTHQLLSSILGIMLSVFLVSVAVYAATTIGTSIETAGTVTMESASTTNDFWLGNVIADDDDYLYFDASSSEYIMWDDNPGEFDLSDDLTVVGVTSSTFGFWAGDGGTLNNVDMTGGDLYVQDDIEVDGEIFSTGSTTASIINMTSIKFTPAATPTPTVTGECFMDSTDYQLNCWNGSAWQYLW
ncbi:hypothetical protein KKE74_00205 [Patescibacteria group bacterium]|nr:hypothetical protein [Patescibacteria group bacterium]MBU2068612.1 hypothetical protein [Patescibacteria group bacterium]MBU2472439.1 hypothetical protein [Patescibacteria group bacterium]